MMNRCIYNLLFLVGIIGLSSVAFAEEECVLNNLTGGIGSSLTRSSFLPRISTDGTRISFESSRDFFNNGADTTRQIFYFDTIANMIVPVTIGGGGTNRLADISGDGTIIVFTSNKNHAGDNADLSQEIFLFDINASSFTQITDSTGVPFSSQEIPFANSDGTKIAFSFSRNLGGNSDGNREVYLFDTNTSTLTQVTATSGSDNFVHGISTDGTRIVFVSRANFTGNNADGNVEIFIYDTTSNMFTQITDIVGGNNTNFANGFPDISDDGTKVVFQSLHDHIIGNNTDGNFEIFLYDTSTSTMTQITDTTGGSTGNPTTNADGTRIAFRSDRNLTGDNPGLSTQIFLYDLTNDMFTRIGGGQEADINSDGTKITFESGIEIFLAECVPGGDTDGDAIPDDEDDCPDSDTSSTIIIDECDSDVVNFIDGSGCSISDYIAEIAAGSSNHGNFVSEVSHLLNELKAAGIINGSDKGAIQSCAGGVSIP